MRVDRFAYPDLSTVEINNKRHYIVGDEKLPSVTTILSETKSEETKKALADWRVRIGEEEAEKVLQTSLRIGSAMHKNIENHFIDPAIPLEGNLQIKTMTNIMLKKGVVNIDEVWGSEAALFFKGLYAGRSDMIGVYKGKPSIIDFKNSVKPKKEKWIGDYFSQCSAYKMAHDSMFNTDIEQYVILVVTQGFEFQEFVIDRNGQQQYMNAWMDHLDKFYS